MPCPTCDHTMHRIDGHGDPKGAMFWCPRCGTLKAGPPEEPAAVPKLVDRCRKFEQQPMPGHDRRAIGDIWRGLGIEEAIHVPAERLYAAASQTFSGPDVPGAG